MTSCCWDVKGCYIVWCRMERLRGTRLIVGYAQKFSNGGDTMGEKNKKRKSRRQKKKGREDGKGLIEKVDLQ